jgi:hypothetical protein
MSKTQMKIATSVAIIGGMIVSAVSASAALNLPTMSCSYTFNTNMKLGSRGTDVMNLQKVLNMYPQTRVAATGAGSPGLETTYFGPATRTAANKFQALHLVELGITAPTGNVFAGTRALLNMACSGTSTLPAGCTSTSGFSPVTGQPCGNGQTTTPTPGQTSGSVSAMLASSQPSGTVVAGQAAARLADITFTGNGTVTSVELQRTGVSSDTTLNNVYLYEGNTRISDAASVITGGYIRFNAPNGLFTVNGSRTISVRADILSTASAGQTVGVKLNSVTAGGAVSTFSNVMGNNFTVAVVSNLTTANLVSYTPVTTRTVDAGTTNLSVFSRTLEIGNHSALLRAATFRFIGSAPVDAVANLSLYVDSVKVAGPSSVNAANDNKVSFDLGSSPYTLQTGSHTVELRGDVIKGSSRTITFVVENAGDLLIEDSQLSGVNVTPSVGTVGSSFQRLTYDTFNVNAGSIVVNADPTFNATTVTGGSSNATIGQFTFKAYGEDVKVSSLTVTPSITGTANNGLSNVALYVNGAQVGTSQNWTATTTSITYNLGSSLIVPAGQTVTVAVKADLRTPGGVNYTAGTVSATLNAGSSNGQGQNSYTIVSVPSTSVTSSSLTVSSGAATFARTSGFTAQTVAPNSSNVKIGSFTIQAGSSEGLVVTGATITASTTGSLNNISNLTVRNGSTILATPTGLVNSTNAINFNNITVPANGSYIFDVYADIGNATSSSLYEFDMTINYRGQVSNTTNSTSADGFAALTTINTATLGTPTVSASSPVTQFVVGGSTFGAATFTLKTTSSGTTANVRELRFNVTGSNDAVQSITVGGVTSSVVNGAATTTGISIPVSFTGTDVPVLVKYSGFRDSSSGGSLTTGVASTSIVLTYVESTSGTGAATSTSGTWGSNGMTLVASKPTVSVSSGNTNTLILGAESKVGEFTVTADANGKISIATTTMVVNAIGVTSPVFGAFRVADGNTTISGSSVATTTAGSSSTNVTISFAPNYEIAAGQSKTFSVYGTVSGSASGSQTPYVASSLTASGFQWRDVVGGNVQYAGTNIYNFPTNSYTTQR